MSQALYAPWPSASRRTWGWGAIGVVLLTYVLAVLPSAFLAAGLIVAETVSGGDPDAAQRALEANTVGFLLPSILSQFFVWAVLIWVWARVFERRGGPTMGLIFNRLAILRYLFGLVLGLLLLLAISGVAQVLGAVATDPDAGVLAGAERLLEPTTVAILAFVVVVFLVQGGAEEVIFRGWLMSTLAARWNVKAAVVVSSLCFMIFHAHVFISGLLFGIIALTGLGMMGLVFALLCLVTRSMVEAIAAHGAFNAAFISMASITMLIESPDLSVSEVLGVVFAVSTGTSGPGTTTVGPEMLAQGLTAGGIAAVLALLLIGRRPFKTWCSRD